VTGTETREGSARTVFLGSGSFAVPVLTALAAQTSIELVGIVTAPPRPAGRGQRLQRSPVAVAAGDLASAPALASTPVHTPGRLRDPEAVRAILDLGPELVVLADYGQIVPGALLSPRHGALNLHPSLLPRHRGATPIPAAILAGDVQTGVSLIRMDEGLDTGPLVAQASVPLDGTETTPSLEAGLAALAADLLASSLDAWLRGDIEPTPQPDAGATLTRPLRRSDGRLDPTVRAVDIERRIRAFQPWPGTYVDTTVGRLVVQSATSEAAPDARRGTFDPRGLGVGQGERIVLGQVQPAGGRSMSWAAFVRGHPAIVGSTIEAAGG
jgi:methionyl-tRNA formyltransferase